MMSDSSKQTILAGLAAEGTVPLRDTPPAAPRITNVRPRCPRCGEEHRLMECPEVASIEFHKNGEVKRVKFIR